MEKFDERLSVQMVNWIFEDSLQIGSNSSAIAKEEHRLEVSKMVSKLLNGEPFDYVMGHSIFYGYRFNVDSNVLIPRPETEELVEWAIQILKKKGRPTSVLDLGTGSGCIAITIKKKVPEASVTGIDISEEALNVARKNAEDLNTEVTFDKIDFLEQVNLVLGRQYDMIISNPPYIDQSEILHMAEWTVGHEPHAALFPKDADALIFYRKLAAIGPGLLTENGVILMEMNEFKSEEINSIFLNSELVEVEVRDDLQGKPRMIKAQRKLES